MPIIKSAIKRVRVAESKRKKNLIVRNNYKGLIKEFVSLVEGGKKKEALALFPTMQKAIDMAAKKNILHKNTAARKKSSLSKMVNDGKATVAKKAPVKKASSAKKEA